MKPVRALALIINTDNQPGCLGRVLAAVNLNDELLGQAQRKVGTRCANGLGQHLAGTVT